jgi:tetratricopeptide (TPR) repeat protein
MDTGVRDRQILPPDLRRVAAAPLQTTAPQPLDPQPLDPQPLDPQPLDPEVEALRCCDMGQLYLELGRYQDALLQVEQALAHHPHHIESWYSRADVLACLGRYQDALECLEQAQTLAGYSDRRGWVQKAVLFILIDQPKAALTCCNQALWNSPHHAQAWLFRGVALNRLGRRGDAYRSYRRAAGAAMPPSVTALRRLYHDLYQGEPVEFLAEPLVKQAEG